MVRCFSAACFDSSSSFFSVSELAVTLERVCPAGPSLAPLPLPFRREDVNSGAKDAHELHARDRLRRNVQWMAGIAPPDPPTLSEMGKVVGKVVDKLLEQHLVDIKANALEGEAPAGRDHLPRRGSVSKQASFDSVYTAADTRYTAADTRVSPGSSMGRSTRASAANGKVEEQPCPQCVSSGGAAVTEAASWSNPALACSLFIADVRSLAVARRAAASSAKASLTRRLQKGSPNHSSAVSEDNSRRGGHLPFGSSNSLRPPPFGSSSNLRPPRRVPSDGVRWGVGVAPMAASGTSSVRHSAAQPDGPLGLGLPYLDHRATAAAAQEAAIDAHNLARFQQVHPAPPGSPVIRAQIHPAPLPTPVFVMSPPGGAAPRAPSPQLQFRLEPMGRSPSPVPRG